MMESLAKLLWPQVKSPHSRKKKLERGRFGLAVGLAWVDVGLVLLFTLFWHGTTLNHPQDLLKNLCSELQRLSRISITSKSQAWNEACRAVSSLAEPGKMPLWLGRNKVWSLRVNISAREEAFCWSIGGLSPQVVVYILFQAFPAGRNTSMIWSCKDGSQDDFNQFGLQNINVPLNHACCSEAYWNEHRIIGRLWRLLCFVSRVFVANHSL